jgi:hypothetical protein
VAASGRNTTISVLSPATNLSSRKLGQDACSSGRTASSRSLSSPLTVSSCVAMIQPGAACAAQVENSIKNADKIGVMAFMEFSTLSKTHRLKDAMLFQLA